MVHQLKFIYFQIFTYLHMFYVVFFNLDIFLSFFILYHWHWHLILLHHSQSYFYVQIANVNFHQIKVTLYIITHVIMITTIYICHHHQLCHKLIQQNIFQVTKGQSMIFKNTSSAKNKKHLIQIIVHKLI